MIIKYCRSFTKNTQLFKIKINITAKIKGSNILKGTKLTHFSDLISVEATM
jgi:hypothetical protein